jgi:dihydrodipicolinate synthase/N-acetylneuraminate lyase
MNIAGITGIIVPIATPMDESGSLDRKGTHRLLEHVIEGGVAGIFALGSTGEFPSLTQHQKAEFIRMVADETRDRVPLYVGVSSTCPADTLALMEEARKTGADAVVALPPYYFPFPDQAALREYFLDLADRAPLPLMLYNVGATYGKPSPLAAETVGKLAAHPNIWGVKDVTGLTPMLYMAASTAALRAAGKPFSIFAGDDSQMAIGVCFGTHGGVNSLANIAPRLYVEAFQRAVSRDLGGLGDAATPGSIMSRILSLHRVYQVPPNAIAAIKGALSILGVCGRAVARPLQPVSQEGLALVRSMLSEAGIL